MSSDFNAPIQACTDPRHTGALRAKLGCNGPDPAGQPSAPDAPSAPAAGRFARGFRLVQRNGVTLDAAQFPTGRIVVMDDPHWGLCSGARSLELLLRSGYDGARVEWADEQLPARTALLEQLLGEAVDWIQEGDLRTRMLDAIDPPTTKASGE
ncbi:hypothetical protein [Streptomyces sp. CA-146814]|uniref:hypothetical protein n=1 Tax=Streptomyces sp. CA-146814 TaxID=3240053 RepID=UPI003D914A34